MPREEKKNKELINRKDFFLLFGIMEFKCDRISVDTIIHKAIQRLG